MVKVNMQVSPYKHMHFLLLAEPIPFKSLDKIVNYFKISRKNFFGHS